MSQYCTVLPRRQKYIINEAQTVIFTIIVKKYLKLLKILVTSHSIQPCTPHIGIVSRRGAAIVTRPQLRVKGERISRHRDL